MNLKSWWKRGFIIGFIILAIAYVLYYINVGEFEFTILEFIFVFIPAIIIGFLLSLIIEFFMNWKKMKYKIFKIVLLIIFFILAIPSILLIMLFINTTTNYCEDDFLRIHEEQSKLGDISICNTFHERGYIGFKGEPICYNRETGKSFTKTDCIIDVARESQNIFLCDNIQGGSICSGGNCIHPPDLCFEEIKNLRDNPSWCEFLLNKKSCLAFIAKKTNNIEMCKSISSQAYHSADCLTNLSVKNNDITLCYNFIENLTDDMDAGFCIEDFQRKTGADWAVCLGIENVDMQQLCFQELVPLSKNKELCDKYVRSCIFVESCKKGGSLFEIGHEELENVRNLCENRTINMFNNELPNQITGILKKNRESIYNCNDIDYVINLIKVNEFYSINDLDAVTLTTNDEIIRNYALNQEYEMLDGTKFVFTSIKGTKENPSVNFIIGCK